MLQHPSPPFSADLTRWPPLQPQTQFSKALRSSRWPAVTSDAERLDAELLRLGNLFEAAWAVERALDAELEADPDMETADWVRRDDEAAAKTAAIVAQIEAVQATTLDGLRVKIRVAFWCHSGEPFDREWLECLGVSRATSSADVRFTLSILRDLSAIDGRPVPAPATAARATS